MPAFLQTDLILTTNSKVFTSLGNLPNLSINSAANPSNSTFVINYSLSEKTFVEETESLKKGAAGAGLTDND